MKTIMTFVSLISAFCSVSFGQQNSQVGLLKENLRVFVSVASENRNQDWARKQCELFYVALNQTVSAAVDCDWNKENTMVSSAQKAAQNSMAYDLFIDARDDAQGTTHLRAVNWNKKNKREFNQLAWHLEWSENYLANIQKLANHIVQLKLNSEIYRGSILAKLSKDSEAIDFDAQKNEFRDRMTGFSVPLSVAEDLYTAESFQKKDYLTTSLEIFGILGAGLTWYMKHSETMSRDWDYHSFSETLTKTLTGERVRFDDNGFGGVNWPHTYSAVPEYLFCRSNGLSLGESFLCSFTASLLWEDIIEFREVLSINDQVATSMGGFVIGESLFQLQRYFSQNRDKGIMSRVFSTVFSSPQKFNNFVQKNVTRGQVLDLSSSAFSPRIWGQAELFLEVAKRPVNAQSTPVRMGFDGRTISISGWNEAGTSQGFQGGDTASTELMFEDVMNDKKAGQDLHVMSKIAFAAWTQKRLSEDDAGRLTGYQFFVAPGSGIEMREGSDDFFGTINILGATAHLELFNKKTKITAQVEMYGDFAMVHSLSIEDYKNNVGAGGLATVLKNNNYYYAVGTTTRGQLILEKNKVAVGASFAVHAWSSVNGRYRFQEQVTNDIGLADNEQEAEVFTKYKISKNVELKFAATTIRRKSNIEGQFDKSKSEHRVTARLSYLF